MDLNTPGKTQKTISRNHIIYFLALILVAAAVVFVLWQRGFIGGKTRAKTPQEITYVIIIRPEGQDSRGTTQADISNAIASIRYNSSLVGIRNFKNELGIKRSDKTQKSFNNTSTDMEFLILVSSPFEDKFGNRSWKPIVSFKSTEFLYYMTNWPNFIKKNLMDIAEDVTWFKKI